MRPVATALTRMLLWLAVRRWPLSIRDGMRREWTAEVEVLRAERRWDRMLAYALSLAVRRPGLAARGAVVGDRRVWGGVALVALGSGAAFLLGYAGLFLYALGPFGLLVFATLLWLGGLLAAEIGALGVAARRPLAVPVVLVPAGAILLALPELDVAPYATTRPTLLWAGLVVVVLAVAGRLSRPLSWWIGHAGVLAASWIAVTWAVWLRNESAAYRLDTAYAALWFPASLMDMSVGPGPVDSELSSGYVVADFAEAYPTMLMALGVFALGYVVGAPRRSTAARPSDEVVVV